MGKNSFGTGGRADFQPRNRCKKTSDPKLLRYADAKTLMFKVVAVTKVNYMCVVLGFKKKSIKNNRN